MDLKCFAPTETCLMIPIPLRLLKCSCTVFIRFYVGLLTGVRFVLFGELLDCLVQYRLLYLCNMEYSSVWRMNYCDQNFRPSLLDKIWEDVALQSEHFSLFSCLSLSYSSTFSFCFALYFKQFPSMHILYFLPNTVPQACSMQSL